MSYNWNRNAAHHRIAMVKFNIYALIQGVVVGLITILSMGIKSDGTREYIVQTAVAGLSSLIICYVTFFVMMSLMYKWLNDESIAARRSDKVKYGNKVYYQDGNSIKLDKVASRSGKPKNGVGAR